MAIEGPLGIRINVWDAEKDAFHSPSVTSFYWPEDGIARAECRATPPCPLDDQEYHIIREGCSCGIYSSLYRQIINQYTGRNGSVWFLIEGLGTGWLHQDDFGAGMTSPAVQVVAIINAGVNNKDNRKIRATGDSFSVGASNAAIMRALEIFKVPVITWNMARAVVKEQWTKEGMVWKEEYL